MKKEIFLISEKYERIKIRKKRTMATTAICKDCGQRFDWLTVTEAAELFGTDREEIKKKLLILRRKIDEHEKKIH